MGRWPADSTLRVTSLHAIHQYHLPRPATMEETAASCKIRIDFGVDVPAHSRKRFRL